MQRLLPRLAGKFADLLSSRRAATAIEYGLIAGLIIVAIISGVRVVGNNVFSNFYNEIAAALT